MLDSNRRINIPGQDWDYWQAQAAAASLTPGEYIVQQAKRMEEFQAVLLRFHSRAYEIRQNKDVNAWNKLLAELATVMSQYLPSSMQMQIQMAFKRGSPSPEQLKESLGVEIPSPPEKNWKFQEGASEALL